IRAPDENVFLASFNTIEIFLLIGWWMSKSTYAEIFSGGYCVLPLVIITWIESRNTYKACANRTKGEEEDDETEEWEDLQGEVDILGDGWEQQVTEVMPDVDKEPAVWRF
ncbi:hypothetical protein L211DRAFT_792961, partial [Terfezia boudieri ATCC MYA-4762]